MSARRLGEAVLVAAALVGWRATARAQSCCSGASAVTPARLAPHEDLLVGAQAKASRVLGSFDAGGHYRASPDHQTESDYEGELLVAARILPRGQLALAVPYELTRRAIPGQSSTGSGIGDVNLGARYDFTLAGSSATIPGIALLFGVTLPTGRPVEDAKRPLATDATGIGAVQGVAGVSLEQTFGPVFVGVSALLSKRAARHVDGVSETPGAQATLLGSFAFAFDDGSAAGVAISWISEADAEIQGAVQRDSGRRQLLSSVVGLHPLGDSLRLQGSLFLTPWFGGAGINQTTLGGATLALLWTLS